MKDDTTCIVVDIIPPENVVQPSIAPKKYNKLQALLFRKKSATKPSKKLLAVGIVEELFEEGSAMLAERLVFCFSLTWRTHKKWTSYRLLICTMFAYVPKTAKFEILIIGL